MAGTSNDTGGKSGTFCSCFMEHDKESFAKFAPLSDNNATLLQHVQLSMESNSPGDLFDVLTYVLEMRFHSPLPIPAGLDNKTLTKRNVASSV